MSKKRFFWLLTTPFLIEWTILAFGVRDRSTWLLENLLVFAMGAPAIWLYFKGWFSKTSYVLIIIFVALHTIGAHYSYSFVPYDTWSKALFGFSINSVLHFERNHYDRLIHFLWGLLLYLPTKEILHQTTKLRGVSLTVFALFTLIVSSAVYELIEWVAALVVGDGTGMAFVGSQGDVWDAQKDQALAIAGALIAMVIFIKKPLPKCESR